MKQKTINLKLGTLSLALGTWNSELFSYFALAPPFTLWTATGHILNRGARFALQIVNRDWSLYGPLAVTHVYSRMLFRMGRVLQVMEIIGEAICGKKFLRAGRDFGT